MLFFSMFSIANSAPLHFSMKARACFASLNLVFRVPFTFTLFFALDETVRYSKNSPSVFLFLYSVCISSVQTRLLAQR